MFVLSWKWGQSIWIWKWGQSRYFWNWKQITQIQKRLESSMVESNLYEFVPRGKPLESWGTHLLHWELKKMWLSNNYCNLVIAMGSILVWRNEALCSWRCHLGQMTSMAGSEQLKTNRFHQKQLKFFSTVNL